MRSIVLKDFGGEVEFQPNDTRLVLQHLAIGKLSAGAADGSAADPLGAGDARKKQVS